MVVLIAIWVFVWITLVIIASLGGDDCFHTGVKRFDAVLDWYRETFTDEQRIYLTGFSVFFGLGWPILLAVTIIYAIYTLYTSK